MPRERAPTSATKPNEITMVTPATKPRRVCYEPDEDGLYYTKAFGAIRLPDIFPQNPDWVDDHVERSANCFMQYHARSGKTPKDAGESWKRMTKDEREPFVEMARLAKAEHKAAYPTYHYNPVPKVETALWLKSKAMYEMSETESGNNEQKKKARGKQQPAVKRGVDPQLPRNLQNSTVGRATACSSLMGEAVPSHAPTPSVAPAPPSISRGPGSLMGSRTHMGSLPFVYNNAHHSGTAAIQTPGPDQYLQVPMSGPHTVTHFTPAAGMPSLSKIPAEHHPRAHGPISPQEIGGNTGAFTHPPYYMGYPSPYPRPYPYAMGAPYPVYPLQPQPASYMPHQRVAGSLPTAPQADLHAYTPKATRRKLRPLPRPTVHYDWNSAPTPGPLPTIPIAASIRPVPALSNLKRKREDDEVDMSRSATRKVPRRPPSTTMSGEAGTPSLDRIDAALLRGTFPLAQDVPPTQTGLSSRGTVPWALRMAPQASWLPTPPSSVSPVTLPEGGWRHPPIPPLSYREPSHEASFTVPPHYAGQYQAAFGRVKEEQSPIVQPAKLAWQGMGLPSPAPSAQESDDALFAEFINEDAVGSDEEDLEDDIA